MSLKQQWQQWALPAVPLQCTHTKTYFSEVQLHKLEEIPLHYENINLWIKAWASVCWIYKTEQTGGS